MQHCFRINTKQTDTRTETSLRATHTSTRENKQEWVTTEWIKITPAMTELRHQVVERVEGLPTSTSLTQCAA